MEQGMPEAADKLTARHVAVVACCCLTCGIPVAMLMNTGGIYYPVIADDFGVPTAEISAWMSIHMVSAAVFSPIVGNIVSRFHMRTLMLTGVLLASTAFRTLVERMSNPKLPPRKLLLDTTLVVRESTCRGA